MVLIIDLNDTGNAAFADGNLRTEVTRIVRSVADKIEAGQGDGYLLDINGNKVGKWWLDDENEDKDESEEN